MLGISLYSYPYLNYQKCFVFLIIVSTLSSTKLKSRTVSVWKRGSRGEKEGGEGRAGEKGGEMTQTLYAHMNKRKKNHAPIRGEKKK
jgi:hypothetical protein